MDGEDSAANLRPYFQDRRKDLDLVTPERLALDRPVEADFPDILGFADHLPEDWELVLPLPRELRM
jgi:hypothetical protein